MAKTFRENLREELNYQDMTVKELSALTNIPKPTLDCYLSARQVIPPADVAVKIANALNVSVEYLITGRDSQNNSKNSVSFCTEEQNIIKDLNSIPNNLKESFKNLLHQNAQLFSSFNVKK